MKKRDLFVFAGQSNMMGAAVLPPKLPITANDTYEYKHKPLRMGAEHGEFVKAGYPCGEFSYTDEAFEIAYTSENTNAEGLSTLNKYSADTYFVPALYNLKNIETHETYPFDHFSEANAAYGAALPPLFANEWEKRGQSAAYIHIAKGGVAITHYFNAEMAEEHNRRVSEYNEQNEEKIALYKSTPKNEGASAYFDRKVRDFFREAEEKFNGEDTSNKIFVWCQGESDRTAKKARYKIRLEILWEHLKALGFTHFFCVRVGFWGEYNENNHIHEVMEAQEEFCRENENCYMITRAMSLIPYKRIANELWFTKEPDEKYRDCRDTAYGFGTPHVNEKGFAVIAEAMADNSLRVLREGKEPVLEEELVKKLVRN